VYVDAYVDLDVDVYVDLDVDVYVSANVVVFVFADVFVIADAPLPPPLPKLIPSARSKPVSE